MAVDAPTLNLVCALLEHLVVHPQRADSSEGIARWWLAEPVGRVALEQALEWLKDEDMIEAVFAADGRVRWRRKAPVAQLAQRLAALRGDPAAPSEDACRC